MILMMHLQDSLITYCLLNVLLDDLLYYYYYYYYIYICICHCLISTVSMYIMWWGGYEVVGKHDGFYRLCQFRAGFKKN